MARFQGWVDRLVRRLRGGARPSPESRRFLIVQIDGLSRSALKQALASGVMPFVSRLLRRDGFRMAPMSVGVPTSTPAFQMAAMYGVKPDIPGFHYHDRRRRADVYFPRVGDAARVEADHAAGRAGILRGGSSHGCVFSGGAERDVFTFAMLGRPTGRSIANLVASAAVLAWVLAKCVWLSLGEIARAVLRRMRHPVRERARGWWWLGLRLGCSVWMRQLYTMIVSAELYAGVPAIYVNYIDYDVFAHAYGPRHRHALRALRGVDAAIRRLCSVLRRVPEHRYDLYILSDHGQTDTTPYQTLHGGQPLEARLFADVLDRRTPPAGSRGDDRAEPLGPRRVADGQPGVGRWLVDLVRNAPWKIDKMPEARERGGIRVVAAGPNAFVYFVDSPEALRLEEIDARHPGLVDELAAHRGIGFVLVRSADGPVCVSGGKRVALSVHDPGPFAGRADLALVLAGIRDLMAMPSAGDLVLYGHGSPDGDVSFIPEHGAHAGLSLDELQTFLIHPARVRLLAPIVHPVQLHSLFSAYRRAQTGVGGSGQKPSL